MRIGRVFVVNYLYGFRRAWLQPATASGTADDDARHLHALAPQMFEADYHAELLPCRIPFPSFFVCRIAILFCLS
jgi:hypothetical protein